MSDECQSLTLAGALIGKEFVSLLAAALETAHRVSAEVITAPVILQAFVDVCRERGQRVKNCTAMN